MTVHLDIHIGQRTDKGVKPSNQDFHGSIIPDEPQRSLKGVAIAIADGISSSPVSHVASETAVASFLNDFFCTSEAWSTHTSGQNVIQSINGWLYAQTQQSEGRYNKDKGYVCTFSAIVFKGHQAHVFHIGDSRVYRIRDKQLEQLTKDHRTWTSSQQSYLSRALGVKPEVLIDYVKVDLRARDQFIVCTDGVYEFCGASSMMSIIEENQHDLDKAAQCIIDFAKEKGSNDNLTCQLARIQQLALEQTQVLKNDIDSLALPPLLKPRDDFEGYTILRQLHANSRSHVYLAQDNDNTQPIVIKIPSVELRDDPVYLERFLIEEWVARRINSAHVMKAGLQQRKRAFLYSVTEYIDGITLAQWLIDNPKPELETVRNIVEQIARGLQALHRKEILHQDLRPENVMIDTLGTVKLIDFGNVYVAGLAESNRLLEQDALPGTALFMAPEYFIGDHISHRSDQYSLAVIAYTMMTGRYPYGAHIAKARTKAAQRKLNYQSVLNDDRAIPIWVDFTLKKALNTNSFKRYSTLSEFIYDLRHPNSTFLNQTKPPLIERNPLLFWKGLSLALALTTMGLLIHILK